MYDLVEWTAEQPWCDGNVGMIGISYFAMTAARGGQSSTHRHSRRSSRLPTRSRLLPACCFPSSTNQTEG